MEERENRIAISGAHTTERRAAAHSALSSAPEGGPTPRAERASGRIPIPERDGEINREDARQHGEEQGQRGADSQRPNGKNQEARGRNGDETIGSSPE